MWVVTASAALLVLDAVAYRDEARRRGQVALVVIEFAHFGAGDSGSLPLVLAPQQLTEVEAGVGADHPQSDLSRQVRPHLLEIATMLLAQLVLPGRSQKLVTSRTSLRTASNGCMHGLVPTRV